MKASHFYRHKLIICGLLVPVFVTAQTYHSVNDVYTDPSIQEGDTLWVMGYYEHPERSFLLEDYGDRIKKEPLPPQSSLIIAGVLPPDSAWYGGFIIAKGTIHFQTDLFPYHLEDTLIAVLEVFETQVILTSFEIPEPESKNEVIPNAETRECDSCKFAILISGGISFRQNSRGFWEDLARLYQFKVNHEGYCPANVIVHYYHGSDSIPKGSNGLPDTRIPAEQVKIASAGSISNSFIEISKRVKKCTSNNKKSVFQKMVTNHGSETGSICLLGSQKLSPAVLYIGQQLIIDSCCSTVYDEFTQCYGGHAVDMMAKLNTRQKANIFINSTADKTPSFAPPDVGCKFLKAKLTALETGKSYNEAVAIAQKEYDTYLQQLVNKYHLRAQYWRENPTAPNATAELESALEDSTDAANAIGKSRNVVITDFKDYCEWKYFVIPKGGQLILDFSGNPNQSGDVCVYTETPSTVPDENVITKVKVWNWNIEGSAHYTNGNKRRVINGLPDKEQKIKIHNDNGQFTLRATSSAKQELAESPSNQTQSTGFSFGGNDGSPIEFGIITTPNYYLSIITGLPRSLETLPRFMGGDYVNSFRFFFPRYPEFDLYYSDMELILNICEVIEPGYLWVTSNAVGNLTYSQYISLPGTYSFHLGDFVTGSYVKMINLDTPDTPKAKVLFAFDSWGLRSRHVPPIPEIRNLQNITVAGGQEICYDAAQSITLAGDNTSFVVENYAVANFAAGQNILMKEHTHFQSGSSVRVFIDLTGDFCAIPETIMSNPVKDIIIAEPSVAISSNQTLFQIYPNPTSGKFSLYFTENDLSAITSVEVFNMLGEKILSVEPANINQYYVFDLTNRQTGLYIIRVIKDNEMGVEKIIKQ